MEEVVLKIIELLAGYEAAILIVGGFILELVLRIKKTDKPASLLAFLARAFSVSAKLLEKLSDILSKIVADKVKVD
jgi:hypothetical protein